MSKRKTLARSSRKTTRKPSVPIPSKVLDRRGDSDRDVTARNAGDLDMIASALADAPALNRHAQKLERFPYNEIASSEAMQRVLLRLVQRRKGASPWLDVYRALERADRTGDDFAAFMDGYRDVTFMAGVEYAVRSIPQWCFKASSLHRDKLKFLELVIEPIVNPDFDGGAR